MNPLAKKIVLVLSILVFGYVATGYVLGRSSDDKAFRALTVYSEVLGYIQQSYVDDPNINSVTNGALHGLLDSLDSESSYLSPLEYKDFKQKTAQNFQAHAGMALSKRIGYISVISVLPDSPAAKAGLQMGDVIEKIGDISTSQMAVEQAQLLLSGPPGTTVKISVIKPEDGSGSKQIELPLAVLPQPKPIEDHLQGGVAYLRVTEFVPGTARQLRDRLVQLNHQGAHELILDLRGCALGDDSEGIAAAQLFLSSGTIASLKGQTVAPQTFSADPSKVVWTQPIAVLIGNGTVGPAEILAASIEDNHRGETVGDRTYGSASVQKTIELDDGSALILTVADYYTPAGKLIASEGLVPQAPVAPLPPDDSADLTREYPPLPSSSPSDPVVHRALQILNAPAAPAKKAA